ncbi:MAG: metal ABC transporter substrate-binding protein [Gemmataceae bacterium]
MRRAGWTVMGLALVVLASGCGKATDPWEDEPGSPRVVVTIAPLASLVRGVAGDRPAIKCLCTTTGPHHYQLDTRDARVLLKADLFLAIGLRLDDSFADAMRSQARRADLTYFKLGGMLPTSSLMQLKHEHKHSAEDEGQPHHHGKWDPHVWLGLDEMSKMAGSVCDAFIKLDPDHADEYRTNTTAYIARLRALHEEGKKLLADKKVRRLISFHEALGYFARSFDLTIEDVIEPGAGDEPSSAHLADLIRRCQIPDRPIGGITVEPQYPRTTSATTIRRELAGKGIIIPLIEIDPLETASPDDLAKEGADWYLSRMRKNLESLASKLP